MRQARDDLDKSRQMAEQATAALLKRLVDQKKAPYIRVIVHDVSDDGKLDPVVVQRALWALVAARKVQLADDFSIKPIESVATG